MPPHTEVAERAPWLALIFTLVANGTLFTSLVFGTFYLWIAAPNWPPGGDARRPAACSRSSAWRLSSSRLPAARGSCAPPPAAARRKPGSGSRRSRSARRDRRDRILIGTSLRIRANTRSARQPPRFSPMSRSMPAIGLLFLISNFLRLAAGFISPRRLTDLRLTRLWLDYTASTGAIALGLVLALPTSWRCWGPGHEDEPFPPRRLWWLAAGFHDLVRRAR